MKPAATRIDSVPKKINSPSVKSAPRHVSRRHKAHDAVERSVQQKPGGHRRHRGRRLAVRIGQPRVDGGEPGFRAIADQDEDEREFHQIGTKLYVGGGEPRPEQRVGRDAPRGLHRRRGKDRSDKGEGDPDRADDQVFPHRLQ